jgi:hypothetical protein
VKLGQLLGLVYADVDRFSTSTQKICRAAHDKSLCDAIKYGSLLKELQRLDLWPRKSAVDIKLSVQDLAEKLSEFRVLSFEFPCRHVAKENKRLEMEHEQLFKKVHGSQHKYEDYKGLDIPSVGPLKTLNSPLTHSEHGDCLPSTYRTAASRIVSTVMDPVLDSHRLHMKTQRCQYD